jgi:hypothetical protein
VKADGRQEFTLFGAKGEKLAVYSNTASGITAVKYLVSFAGKLVSERANFAVFDSGAVFRDRLGTNRASGARFRPYGDEITSTSQDREKFATYNRDGFRRLDYADQRYYAASLGRCADFKANSMCAGQHVSPGNLAPHFSSQLVDTGFSVPQRFALPREHKVACCIDFNAFGARKIKDNGTRIGPRRNLEIVFELIAAEMVNKVDPGIHPFKPDR